MIEFFKPYEGKKPYVFISYSHRDSEAVIDTIRITGYGMTREFLREATGPAISRSI